MTADEQELSALCKDAFYSARDAGRTMHQAADDAARSIIAAGFSKSAIAGGDLSRECPRLGRMVCIRQSKHDPHSVGGHQYAAPSVPDGHDASEARAEETRS